MKTTIREVARRAGVSISTVSRVFNETAVVDETTREKVRAAARDLHYTPNQAARSLVMNETRTIGLILPNIFGEYYSELIRGMDEVASARDYDILITGSKSLGTKFEKSILSLSGRVDGLIIMSPALRSDYLRTIIPPHLPAVLLNAAGTSGAFPTVSVNNRDGATMAVNHLIRLGHTRIAIITGLAQSEDAVLRTEGYRDAMRAAGLEQGMLEVGGAFTLESGAHAARAIVAQPVRPTAVFCANDAMAIGALNVLAEHGLAVPHDIALVGFDDIPSARFTVPPLTTVRVDLPRFGAAAMEELITCIAAGTAAPPVHRTVDCALVVRSSCGTP